MDNNIQAPSQTWPAVAGQVERSVRAPVPERAAGRAQAAQGLRAVWPEPRYLAKRLHALLQFAAGCLLRSALARDLSLPTAARSFFDHPNLAARQAKPGGAVLILHFDGREAQAGSQDTAKALQFPAFFCVVCFAAGRHDGFSAFFIAAADCNSSFPCALNFVVQIVVSQGARRGDFMQNVAVRQCSSSAGRAEQSAENAGRLDRLDLARAAVEVSARVHVVNVRMMRTFRNPKTLGGTPAFQGRPVSMRPNVAIEPRR